MKLCKDCRHYEEGILVDSCHRANLGTRPISLVTGVTAPVQSVICAFERMNHDGSCGPDAVFWEAKDAT